MASLSKEFSETKQTGRVYTPANVVSLVLDEVGFVSPESLGQPILDPACGDGQFLVEIVRRILTWSPESKLRENLEFVYGWDIDENAVEEAMSRLNDMVAPLVINWKIKVLDSVRHGAIIGTFDDDLIRFSYIVGNPPYVRIQHLDLDTRAILSRDYNFCSLGSTDLYLAFFELAAKLLSDSGKCAYITPNSYLSTSAGKPMRKFFSARKSLYKIINFGATQLFEDASTYAAITTFGNTQKTHLTYERRSSIDLTDSSVQVPYSEVAQFEIWNFEAPRALTGQVPLSSICEIHVGIQTLSDKVFIFGLDAIECGQKFTKVRSAHGLGTFQIESDLLLPAVKASKIKPDWDGSPDSMIIWPYAAKPGEKTEILPESELMLKFPLGYEYLLAHKSILDMRDNGRPNPFGWYAFGRQQHLDKVRMPKIVFPPMVETPFFCHTSYPNLVVYSGYFISYAGEHNELLNYLNSSAMKDWVEASGRDLRGAWKSVSKSTIKNFPVPGSLAVLAPDGRTARRPRENTNLQGL